MGALFCTKENTGRNFFVLSSCSSILAVFLFHDLLYNHRLKFGMLSFICYHLPFAFKSDNLFVVYRNINAKLFFFFFFLLHRDPISAYGHYVHYVMNLALVSRSMLGALCIDLCPMKAKMEKDS